jgi:hypothetical protein
VPVALAGTEIAHERARTEPHTKPRRPTNLRVQQELHWAALASPWAGSVPTPGNHLDLWGVSRQPVLGLDRLALARFGLSEGLTDGFRGLSGL